MKNFVFISPNFPTNYWKFCRHLKDNGINVLGIGDQPYDDLLPELLKRIYQAELSIPISPVKKFSPRHAKVMPMVCWSQPNRFLIRVR